jgi:hypothetical protein
MLALLSALIVAAFDRRWLSGPVSGFIPKEGPSLERLSRLKAHVLSPMEELVSTLTRRGRPARPPASTDESLVLRELLLLVPPETWTYLSCERRAALVAAQERLQREHRLPAKRFCALLKISHRTFRHWKAKAAVQASLRPPNSDAKPPARPSPLEKNPGRFALEVTAPGIQAVGDTTAWELLGVPLKIVAVQDPGGRKQKLWESFAVDTTEDAELVVEVVAEALKGTPGVQVITDQGAPYMAQLIEEALENMELDHAPQKEGTPTAKATKERAFGLVKQALQPLVDLSRRIAEKVPALRRPDLARALARILLTVYLRVYEAAPRCGGHPLEGEGTETLRVVIEEQRERARAEENSKRLLLTTIHRAYDFKGTVDRFIRAHRHVWLEDIQDAEKRLRRRAIKSSDEIRNYQAYFTAVLRNIAEVNRTRRARERARKLAWAREEKERTKERQQARAQAQRLRDHPELHLREGLDIIAAHWRPTEGVLLFQGRGPGGSYVLQALKSMDEQDPYTVMDKAEAAWKTWAATHAGDQSMVAAVRKAFDRKLAEFVTPPPTTGELTSNRMRFNSRPRNRPLTQQADLRNYPARSWG